MAKKNTPQNDEISASAVAVEEEKARRLEQALARQKRARKALEELRAAEDLEAQADNVDAGAVAADLGSALPGAALVEKIVADLNGEGSFDVWKIDGERSAKIAAFDIITYPGSMEGVIRQHGRGNYSLIFRHPNGSIIKKLERFYEAPAASAAAAVPGAAFDLMSFMKISEEREARREAQIEKMREASAASQNQFMLAMIEMVKGQNKPMINNASELAAVANLFGSKKSGLSEIREIMDLVEDFRGDAPETRTEIRTESPLVAALVKIADHFANSRPAPRPAPVAPAPVAINPPSPAVAAASTHVEPLPPVARPGLEVKPGDLSEHIPMLRTAIVQGITPDHAAQMTFDDAAGKNSLDKLADLVEAGNWDGLKAAPELAEFAKWVEDFRAELRKRVNGAISPK